VRHADMTLRLTSERYHEYFVFKRGRSPAAADWLGTDRAESRH